MENLKESLPVFLAVILAIGLIILGGYFFEYQEEDYYTQIDNTKIKQLFTSDNMKYEYTLTCYNSNGRKKEYSFKTSRELRKDAFLKLNTSIFVGVRKWEEISYDELPEKVKSNYLEN